MCIYEYSQYGEPIDYSTINLDLLNRNKSTTKMSLEFPRLYLLDFRFSDPEELLALQNEIGGSLVKNFRDAEVVIGRVKKTARARYEFRSRGVYTEELSYEEYLKGSESEVDVSRAKKRKVKENSTGMGGQCNPYNGETIKVLRLDWYHDSVKAGKLLSPSEYLVYEGRIIDPPKAIIPSQDITVKGPGKHDTPGSKHFFESHMHETTSDEEQVSDLPPLPRNFWKGAYACQRPTLGTCPNDAFISQLRIIKTERLLTRMPKSNDERDHELAYSRAIATIAAYPYKLKIPQEVKRLPNCGVKCAALFEE